MPVNVSAALECGVSPTISCSQLLYNPAISCSPAASTVGRDVTALGEVAGVGVTAWLTPPGPWSPRLPAVSRTFRGFGGGQARESPRNSLGRRGQKLRRYSGPGSHGVQDPDPAPGLSKQNYSLSLEQQVPDHVISISGVRSGVNCEQHWSS